MRRIIRDYTNIIRETIITVQSFLFDQKKINTKFWSQTANWGLTSDVHVLKLKSSLFEKKRIKRFYFVSKLQIMKSIGLQ